MRTFGSRWLEAAALAVAATALHGCASAPAILGGIASAITVGSWIERQAGSGAAPTPQPAASADEFAYRQGIRDALSQLRRSGGLAAAAAIEPPRVAYVGPVLEEVWVPAQIVGGVLIPAHRQWVVVRPGYWQVGGQPLMTNAAAPLGPPAFTPATWAAR